MVIRLPDILVKSQFHSSSYLISLEYHGNLDYIFNLVFYYEIKTKSILSKCQ